MLTNFCIIVKKITVVLFSNKLVLGLCEKTYMGEGYCEVLLI